MSKQTMSELVAAYNELALSKGKEEVSSFKNLSAARAALKSLESNSMIESTESTESTEVETSGAPGLDTPGHKGPKYNSTGKRGPTQGIGKFCKELILEGKTNTEILVEVAEQFPTAKTTANCVAYYRAKLAKGAAVPAVEEVAEEEVAA